MTLFIRSSLQALALWALPLALAAVLSFSGAVMAKDTILSGQFSGANGHVTTGSVTIEKSNGKVLVVLAKNFSLDGAPEPTIGFSKAGKFDKATEFASLKANKGKQTYELPASINPSAYDRIHIWCSKFSVSLGSAKLN